jgi:aspartate/methionine/tyrosine aminotransferase
VPVEPFLIERFFAAHEFTTPHLLGVSDCETRTVGELLALDPDAEERLRSLALGYTEGDGHAELRAAIAATYERLGPEDVLVHAAGVEVLLTVALAVLEPGDHAVVHHPGYQAQRTSAGVAGADVSLWWARPELGWAPDLDELAGLLDRPRTRLLVVTTPHNPTGYHFDETGLRHVLRLAEERGVTVLVDEAYRGTEYEVGARTPSAVDLSESACALGLTSKALGLPGLRIGWLATRDPALRASVALAKDYTSICAPAPSELLATIALRHWDRLLAETRVRLVRHLALFADFVGRHDGRFDWVPPRAGPVTFPTLEADRPEELSRRLREEAGVLVVPGTVFDDTSREIRVGFGRADFPEGLACFDAWLTADGGGGRS